MALESGEETSQQSVINHIVSYKIPLPVATQGVRRAPMVECLLTYIHTLTLLTEATDAKT